MTEATKTQWSKIQGMAVARAFSLLGSELTLFTLVFREKDLGPGSVAALFIIGTLPAILMAPLAGTLADRYSTRSIIPIFSVVGGVAVFAQTQHLPTWLILTLLFISNSCASVVAPTWGKLTRTLATQEDYSRASGVIQTYFSIAMLTGPFIAGVLVDRTGFVVTFLIDGFFTTFIALMPFILRVNYVPTDRQEGKKTKLTGGFTHIFNDSFLRSLTIMVFAMVLCISVVNVGDVFLLTEKLNANALIYGLVGGCFAVGTLIGSLAAGAIKISPKKELVALSFGLAVLSLSGIAVGLAQSYWFVMVVWFFAGLGNACINTYGVGMMIRAIPMEVQGRAFAAFNGIISVAGIGSQAVAGIILYTIDVRTLFVAAGILACIAFVSLFPIVYREQVKVIETSSTPA
jgi:MFS family permease